MAVVQSKYEDQHRPSGKSTSDMFGGVDADTKAVIRAINANLNEHIEETGKRFDCLEAKVDDGFAEVDKRLDDLVEDVSGLKDDVKAIREHLEGRD